MAKKKKVDKFKPIIKKNEDGTTSTIYPSRTKVISKKK